MRILTATGIRGLDEEISRHSTAVYRASSIDEAAELARRVVPDAVVLSVYLPGRMDAVETACQLNNEGFRVLVLIGGRAELKPLLMKNGVAFLEGKLQTASDIVNALRDRPRTAEGRYSRSYVLREIKKEYQTAATSGEDYRIMTLPEISEEEEKQDESHSTPILGLWGPKPGLGVGSIARGLARAAAVELKTLLVELDFRYPQQMFMLGISDNDRCLERALQHLQENTSGGISEYILRGKGADRQVKGLNLPDGLHLLAPGVDRGIELFPKVAGDEVVSRLFEQVRDEFDVVIVDLPSEVDSFLTVGAMKMCTHLIVVLDGCPANMWLLEKRLALLKRIKIPVISKTVVVTCNLPEGVTPQIVQQACGLKVIWDVPHDDKMGQSALYFQTGSIFEQSVQGLAVKLGITRERIKPRQEPRRAVLPKILPVRA